MLPLLIILTMWMWKTAAATPLPSNIPILKPVFNDGWKQPLQLRDRKRDYDFSHLDLQEKEQFLWGSPDNSSQSTVFSMMVYTKDEELVISMERFAHELSAVNCSQNMSLTFKSVLPFRYVMSAWNWVNVNGTRTFVMVANYPGCGNNDSREPWVVSNVHFDNSSLTIRLDATKKTWPEVLHTYDLDFGDLVQPGTNERRFLDVNLDRTFTVDLSSKLPTELFKTTTPNNISLAIDCIDCGTKGTLVFEGHISASLFDGITAITLSATPHGIEADLKLSIELIGSLSFEVADVLQLNKRLLTLPIPSGFSIPGVLTFGPNVDINAGLSLDSLEGSATITTGVTAKIPDTSVAKIDLHGKKALDISGWIPQFTTDPIVIEAEIDAEVELYTELAVAVSLLILDEDGFNVDLGLRVPDVYLTSVTEYDPSGVCPGSSQPVGVTIDATIGVELVLEGFTEASGVEHSFLNVPLFNDSSIFTFPPFCLPFGSVSGVCLYTPQSPDDADYEASEDTGGVDKRGQLMPRAPDRKRRPYWIACDAAKTEIRVQGYPKPSAIKKPNSKYDVPIMKPGIEQCQEHPSCPETDWKVIKGVKTDLSVGNWATEHVYEGNWVKQYLDYIQSEFFKNSFGTPQIDCQNEVFVFGKVPTSITTPDPQGPSNFSEALMQNLGTIYTANTRLAVFPQEQNQVKNLIFAGFDLYSDFTKATTSNEDRVCKIGKIITICEYLNDPLIMQALTETVTALEGVLSKMDLDPTVDAKTPAKLKGKYKETHTAWFNTFYGAGFKHAQTKLQEYADNLKGRSDFGTLNADMQASILKVANNPADYCDNKWVHP